jgi:hypothetical protein
MLLTKFAAMGGIVEAPPADVEPCLMQVNMTAGAKDGTISCNACHNNSVSTYTIFTLTPVVPKDGRVYYFEYETHQATRNDPTVIFGTNVIGLNTNANQQGRIGVFMRFDGTYWRRAYILPSGTIVAAINLGIGYSVNDAVVGSRSYARHSDYPGVHCTFYFRPSNWVWPDINMDGLVRSQFSA